MSILSVGVGQEFTTIAAAVAASHDGDVVAVQAGTYTNDFATINTKITIEGVGGMVRMLATESPPNGKAILTTNTDVTLDHIEFSGVQVSDQNGAGVRYQSGNLTVTNCYFHNNQEGILGNPQIAGTGTISISNSEFAFNGAGDGYSHNLYVGDVAALVIDQSYFHDAVLGHEIKSRAEQTTITNSRIQDGPAGTASYSIDLPNGGATTIQNDVIEQGPNSQNPAIIAFGEEGSLHNGTSLSVDNSTILNDLHSVSASAVMNPMGAPVSLAGNAIYGLSAIQILSGAGTVTGTTMLPTEPGLVTTSPWAGLTAAPAPAPVAAPPPATGTAPASDTLVLSMSEDAYLGDAQFTVSVDGMQLGAVQTVTALHGQGQTQAFSFAGSFAAGAHVVDVDFLNDAWGGGPAADRNLYVNAIGIDGATDPTASGALYSDGTQAFSVAKLTAASAAPATVAVSNTLVLNMSEDAWQGDAQFTVSVDGSVLGGVQTVTAAQNQGQTQAFSFANALTAGAHTVSVDFLNDAYGGSASADRNLYVDSIDAGGTVQPGAAGALYSDGTTNFAVSATATATATAQDTLVLHLSEDSYLGDAQFIASIDGNSLGGTQSVTALHGQGQTQDFTFTGSFGLGPHDLAVSFLNDAYGGSSAADRNLYVDSVDLNGVHYTEGAVLASTGTVHFQIGSATSL